MKKAPAPVGRRGPDGAGADGRGLTTGEVAVHFADVYDAEVSEDTISQITYKVIEDIAEW